MAMKQVCDRCDKEIYYANRGREMDIYDDFLIVKIPHKIILCKDCYSNFIHWLHEIHYENTK